MRGIKKVKIEQAQNHGRIIIVLLIFKLRVHGELQQFIVKFAKMITRIITMIILIMLVEHCQLKKLVLMVKIHMVYHLQIQNQQPIKIQMGIIHCLM